MAVDETAWDGPAAMSRCAGSDDPAAAYRAICAGRRDGDPAVQSTWALPHHANPGDPPNADGVRNSLSRLPQTEGLTNAEAAQAHLDAHMAEISPAERSDYQPVITTEIPDSEITVRSMDRREIEARIVPWDVAIETPIGLESFKRGAFSHINPRHVVLRLGHDGEPVGAGLSLEERDDGAHMVFRVSKTQRGDDALTLAADGVTRHVSVEYAPRESQGQVVYRNRQRVTELTRAALKGVATTYVPAYPQAEILAVREAEGAASMPDNEPAVGAAPIEPPVIDMTPITASITALEQRFADRFLQLEERSRSNFTIPSAHAEPDVRGKRGDWMSAVIRMLSGERVNDLQMRELADLVTSDNVGVVPDAYLTEMIGVIDPSRPFLQSTRKLDLPAAGMSLVVPKIVTRPTAGVQAVYGDESYPEKSEITSTTTSITNVTYDAVTIAGGGDIGLQLLKRSSPSYLSLYLELLAEAYGSNAESAALATLIALVGAPGGVNDGGTLDPEALVLGDAWAAGAAVKKPINTMWLGSAAVGKFIDAKVTGSNAPLYSSIQAGFTAGAGVGGTISGLKPVWVPALDASGVDVLVGPSAGFGWTEDGTYTLQVDVPAKAGRDVALVGILWFAPMYPTAFTAYGIAS
jgi:HK97 family phage prohead protease